jgi:PilZ domain
VSSEVSEITGPMPTLGDEVWIENAPGGPLGAIVFAVRDDCAGLSAPRRGGQEVPLRGLDSLMLSYRNGDVPCEAEAELTDPPYASGPAIGPWVRVRGITRMQRRDSVRVPMELIARIEQDGHEEPIPAITEDLSAGGTLLRVAQEMNPDEPVRIVVECGGDVGTIDTAGRIIRQERHTTRARGWHVAIAFTVVGAALEDRLVRFLFDRLRENRRREAGIL